MHDQVLDNGVQYKLLSTGLHVPETCDMHHQQHLCLQRVCCSSRVLYLMNIVVAVYLSSQRITFQTLCSLEAMKLFTQLSMINSCMDTRKGSYK